MANSFVPVRSASSSVCPWYLLSASFNAPIAGALFALEVVLRHFAVHAFAPIVIASAVGTVLNRLVFGDVTEFVLPVQNALAFYVELPAFLILGLVCGLLMVNSQVTVLQFVPQHKVGVHLLSPDHYVGQLLATHPTDPTQICIN